MYSTKKKGATLLTNVLANAALGDTCGRGGECEHHSPGKERLQAQVAEEKKRGNEGGYGRRKKTRKITRIIKKKKKQNKTKKKTQATKLESSLHSRRTEVVRPIAQTVRLVNAQQPDGRQRRNQPHELRRRRALGREKEDANAALWWR